MLLGSERVVISEDEGDQFSAAAELLGGGAVLCQLNGSGEYRSTYIELTATQLTLGFAVVRHLRLSCFLWSRRPSHLFLLLLVVVVVVCSAAGG